MKRRYVLGQPIEVPKRVAKLRRRCKSVRDLFITGYLEEIDAKGAEVFRNDLSAECNEKCAVKCQENFIEQGRCSPMSNDPATSDKYSGVCDFACPALDFTSEIPGALFATVDQRSDKCNQR
jgi:hypothetical protein